MNRAIAFFCLWSVLVLWAGPAHAQDAGQLAGRWRSVETSKGGIGAMYDFQANGAVSFSPGAIVPSPYRIEGDRLTIGVQDPAQYTVAFNGESHLRLTIAGQSEEYTRLGNPVSHENLLLGEWTGNRDMDGQKVLVHWIFGADSSALLMIRFTTVSGNFTLQNGRLVATFGGRGGLDGSITLSGDVLSITRSPTRVTKLVRY